MPEIVGLRWPEVQYIRNDPSHLVCVITEALLRPFNGRFRNIQYRNIGVTFFEQKIDQFTVAPANVNDPRILGELGLIDKLQGDVRHALCPADLIGPPGGIDGFPVLFQRMVHTQNFNFWERRAVRNVT